MSERPFFPISSASDSASNKTNPAEQQAPSESLSSSVSSALPCAGSSTPAGPSLFSTSNPGSHGSVSTMASAPANGGGSIFGGLNAFSSSPTPEHSVFGSGESTTPSGLFSSTSTASIPIRSTPPLPANTGTINAGQAPYLTTPDNTGPGTIQEFQTITFRSGHYQQYSLEELRVIDYATGRKPKAATISATFGSTTSMWGACTNLDLLKGPGMEVIVGQGNSVFSRQETWSISKALLSHHSPFLKAACTRDFKEREDGCLKLPADDPNVFSLFVEWVYYGEYKLRGQNGFPFALLDQPCIYAKAWVLGDKLVATAFKNYSVDNLYAAHTMGSRAVFPADVSYVCTNTIAGSALRHFYFDFVATHWSDSNLVGGTVADWDNLLQDHEDARMSLLVFFRLGAGQRNALKPKQDYMEKDDALAGTLVNTEGASG